MWRGTTKDVQQREIDFANGDHITTNELGGRKSTYPGKYAGPSALRDPKASCANVHDTEAGLVVSGEDNIAGYRAVRMVMNVGSGGTLTMWYGLDLGCAVVQSRFQHESGQTEQKLAAVILGEPDAALFQLSASLKEVPPSELFACPQQGRACTPLPDEMKQRLDKTYDDARAKAGI